MQDRVSADGDIRLAPSRVPPRIVWFAVALLLECVVSIVLPHYRLSMTPEERGVPFAFVAALLFFGRNDLDASGVEAFPVRYRFVVLNILCFAGFLLLEHQLAVWTPEKKPILVAPGYLVAAVVLWIALFILLVLALTAVVAPLREVAGILRKLGPAWLYAGACAALSMVICFVAGKAWNVHALYFEQALEDATFDATKHVLGWIYPQVVSIPTVGILGTPHFSILIKGWCSGIEGMTLIATLTVAWLIFARRELQMDRAILLVPLSIVVIWLMNLGRLVVLIAIGNAGHRQAAINGFHSVAGWISFNLVSVCFLLAANRVRWFRKPESEFAGDGLAAAGATVRWRNLPAIYLTPFLAIVAASLVSLGTTGSFEWLYPLRFVVAVVALWYFRKEYLNIDWKFGWAGVVAGLAVAMAWLAVRLWVIRGPAGPNVTAVGLARLPGWERVSWVAVRVLAAVTTVPIAEELAFRGFAARRVMSEDVESVPYARLSFMAILVSSVLFGVMHGDMWAMGIASGVVFALLAKFRGRLGEAVAAHVVANLVIAVAALALRNYSLW